MQNNSRHRKSIVVQCQPEDVLLGRGNFRWEGNQRFQAIVRQHSQRYNDTTCRYERSRIIFEIMGSVQNWGGRFLHPSKVNYEDCATWPSATPPPPLKGRLSLDAIFSAGHDMEQQHGSSRTSCWTVADRNKIQKKIGQALRYHFAEQQQPIKKTELQRLKRQKNFLKTHNNMDAAEDISCCFGYNPASLVLKQDERIGEYQQNLDRCILGATQQRFGDNRSSQSYQSLHAKVNGLNCDALRDVADSEITEQTSIFSILPDPICIGGGCNIAGSGRSIEENTRRIALDMSLLRNLFDCDNDDQKQSNFDPDIGIASDLCIEAVRERRYNDRSNHKNEDKIHTCGATGEFPSFKERSLNMTINDIQNHAEDDNAESFMSNDLFHCHVAQTTKNENFQQSFSISDYCCSQPKSAIPKHTQFLDRTSGDMNLFVHNSTTRKKYCQNYSNERQNNNIHQDDNMSCCSNSLDVSLSALYYAEKQEMEWEMLSIDSHEQCIHFTKSDPRDDRSGRLLTDDQIFSHL